MTEISGLMGGRFAMAEQMKAMGQSWMKDPVRFRVALWLWLGTLAFLVLLWGIGEIGLIDETEPLFVEAARWMYQTGDWITPYFNGETRFDKPPLIYWLMVLCFKIFGVNETAARLPSVFSAIIWVAMGGALLSRYGIPLSGGKAGPLFRQRATWLGATMLLLNLNTYFWGRTGYADMLFATCLGGTFFAFFQAYAQRKSGKNNAWVWGFYICLSLAILTKGPAALVLVGLVLVSFCLYLGNFRQVLTELRLKWGLLLLGALSVPWYVAVILRHRWNFINNFFGYHNLERYTQVVSGHEGPWYFHLLVILVAFFPWSLYLPAAIAQLKLFNRKEWKARSRQEQLGLYAFFWLVAIVIFFSLSVTKYFSYTLPTMPAAAILVALLGAEGMTTPAPRWSISRWLNVGVMGVLGWALFNCPAWLGSDPWMPKLGERIATANLPLIGGVLWGIAAALGIIAVLWRSHLLTLINVVAMLLCVVLVLHPAIAIVDGERQLPLREMAAAAAAMRKQDEVIVMYGFRKPSLVFYSGRNVEYAETQRQFETYWKHNKEDFILISTPKLLQKAGVKDSEYRLLKESGVYRLVRKV
jgi:4-amino-4-deoxy-L-arabinose transferase-like glycosyltransferase